ncbi:MAG TPA: DUF4920 domain-containing protein [Flavobacteriaceae bacterium]|nr:DUF4920 domain-containing protein [Flavobacteriaceae bacterium]
MKKIILLALLTLSFVACKNSGTSAENAQDQALENVQEFVSFGAEISADGAIDAEAMMAIYADLKEGDTIATKFQGSVNSVCKMKGCWMRLAVGDQEAFVKFKDYGFFVPKYLSEVEVIVSGKAYVSKTSVEDLKHFAQDAGKPQEEIDAITEPELSLDFMADGVLVPAEAIIEEAEQDNAAQDHAASQDAAQ